MNQNRRKLILASLGAAATAAATVGHAQSFPDRPITLIVSYPPGGDTDAMARLYAEKLTTRLKQSVIVENRPGAGGTLGNTMALKARPDGYTLLFTPNPFTTAPAQIDSSQQLRPRQWL
jgi:tripartite-type tricarboxylate transporter receptor subunit TctC